MSNSPADDPYINDAYYGNTHYIPAIFILYIKLFLTFKKCSLQPGEVDKKDDSGNETGAGEAELEEDSFPGYDKNKSFFDNISCEAVER